MYRDDQPRIAEFARTSPEATAHVIKFVLCSIRRRIELVDGVLRRVARGDFRGLCKFQRDGIAYVDALANDVYTIGNYDDVELVTHYLQVPGLGIAKAGFAAQLLHGVGGCLDTHNLRMLGLHANTFYTPATIGALRKRIKMYLDACENAGDSEKLWDRWCAYVAKLRPGVWSSAQAVSQYHVRAIIETFPTASRRHQTTPRR